MVKDRQSASRLRYFVFALVTVSLTIVLCLGSAEVVLRFLPVPSGLRTQPVDAKNPVFHFTPDRNATFSRGWDFEMVNHRRVNNVGWVNDQNYKKDDKTPLLAVIGDSYIEALMVPYDKTAYGRLAKELDGRLRVYSFGASGAALSQYLIWANHAVREYGARAVVINVVGNDFDESHVSHGLGPGFWLYAPDGDGTLRLRLNDYDPGWVITILRESALARYLILNLKFHETIFRLRALRELIFGTPAQ